MLSLKMESILADCGDVCETRPGKQDVVGKKYFKALRKNFECRKLFESKVLDLPPVSSTPVSKVRVSHLEQISFPMS